MIDKGTQQRVKKARSNKTPAKQIDKTPKDLKGKKQESSERVSPNFRKRMFPFEYNV